LVAICVVVILVVVSICYCCCKKVCCCENNSNQYNNSQGLPAPPSYETTIASSPPQFINPTPNYYENHQPPVVIYNAGQPVALPVSQPYVIQNHPQQQQPSTLSTVAGGLRTAGRVAGIVNNAVKIGEAVSNVAGSISG